METFTGRHCFRYIVEQVYCVDVMYPRHGHNAIHKWWVVFRSSASCASVTPNCVTANFDDQRHCSWCSTDSGVCFTKKSLLKQTKHSTYYGPQVWEHSIWRWSNKVAKLWLSIRTEVSRRIRQSITVYWQLELTLAWPHFRLFPLDAKITQLNFPIRTATTAQMFLS